MHLEITALVVGLLSPTALSSPAKAPKLNTRQLVELPGVWIENLAARSNGNLLLNTFDHGQMYSVDPSRSPPEARVVAKVEGTNALTGIAETSRDVFAIAGGIFDAETSQFQNGSMKIALADFRRSGDGKPSVRVILEGEEAGIINGMTTLPHHRHIILGASSLTGEILRINTRTGRSEVAFQDAVLAPIPGGYPIGVNGINIFGNHLYFTITGRQALGRVKIDEFGNKMGNIQVIARGPADSNIGPDDFTMDKHGNAFIGFFPNLLIKITPNAEQTVLINGTLAGPTSTVFSKDGRSLYAATAGQGVEGVQGGQVIKVDF
ncbi:hypothetical protein EDB81DRAFT_898798 [Dactylonectria macrodidyma]|uniref:SMP-30/Gluconolactonase/LRE-like region domain-containing protein n=1 Tax=Dactylonectria macrodidyma TaxID=307937 RepID=A0A9P9FVP8_9HYPO|nr:hypothetical protein EDB81DRAFT_898798 [Dactylonectria macrodidyma]